VPGDGGDSMDLADFSVGSVLIISLIGFAGFVASLTGKIEFLPIWAGIAITIIAAELYFWKIDKDKPEAGEDKLKFAAFHKAEGLGFGLIVSFSLNGIVVLAAVVWTFFEENMENIINFILNSLIGIGLLMGLAVLLVVYIYLNSLKYRNIPDKPKKKKRRR
jgi:hypothetical protein